MFYFRDLLIAAMKKQRVTQEDVVKNCKVSKGFITKITSKSGCKTVDLHKLSLVTEYLKINQGRLINVCKQSGKGE